MKQKLLKLLSIFVAFLTAIPIANAANITFSVSDKWNGGVPGSLTIKNNTTGDYEGTGKSIAVSNGVLYVIDPKNYGTIDYVNPTYSSWPEFPTGYDVNTFGYAMDNDDAGNIVISTGFTWVGAAMTKLAIYPAGAKSNAEKKEVTLTGDYLPGSRVDYLGAEGNIMSANGGYVWIAPSGSKKIMRIKIAKNGNNLELAGLITWTHSLEDNNNNETIIQPLGNGKIYIHNRGVGYYVMTLPNETGGEIPSANIETITTSGTAVTPSNNLGSDLFYLLGNTFHIRHAGIANKDIRFVINNITNDFKGTNLLKLDETENTTIVPFNGITTTGAENYLSGITSSYYTNVGTIVKAVEVDATKVDIYCYTPLHGASCYRVTANVTTETVSNVNATANDGKAEATITWTKPATDVPTNYHVSYSSDGGTTWSTPVVTTDLSYTFTDLNAGTYTFKVAPYYEQYLTYGAEVKTSAVEVTATPEFGYSFVVTKLWEVPGTLGGITEGKSIAVSNNMVYVAATNKDSKIYPVGQSTTPNAWTGFESGYAINNFGYAMDNDDAGNIVVTAGFTWIGAPATKFGVYPAGATSSTSKREISLSGDYLPGARTDYIGTTGDIYNGTGYIWLAPQNAKTIKRIKIENKSGVPTPTGITTWTHSLDKDNFSEVIVRPLEDGRLYYHNRSNSYCNIITLPAGGGEIPSANVETISLTNYQTENFSSDAILLKGNLLNIRNAGVANQDISFEIYNATTGDFAMYNNERIITPFGGVRTDGTENPLSGFNKYGSIIRAVKVDDETVDVYLYSPFHGASCYRIGAEALNVDAKPVENLKGEFKFNDVGELWGRQDVVLTWDEPVGYSGATITGYNIYRDNKLQKTVDASTRTFTDINIVASPTYVVAPLYNGIEMEPKSITVDYTFIPIPPVELTARTYDGYGSVQLFWKRTTDVGIKPNYYNIYRDGILVGVSQTFNFYEDKLSAGVHKYEVEAVYNEMDDKYISEEYGRAAKSDPVTINVEARDFEKTMYTLEEIYNYTLDEINNQPANFNDRDYYRQGAYYNGKWYIAQRSDYLTKNDSPEEDGVSDWESGVATATGGIVKFSAEDPRTGVESKPITLPEGSNVGVATDDKGNIFVRHNNIDRIATTTPNGGTAVPSWLEDYFARRFTSGYIYLAKEGYSEATRVDVDLSGLYTNRNLRNILPDWNELAQDAYVDNVYKSQRGRSDYYSLEGDVTSTDGGYLYFSPSKSPYVIKVNIKVANGVATVDATNAVIVNLAGEHETVDGTMAKVTYGIENYAFPVNNRNNFISQIRSNGYFGIHKENGENHIHPIFTTESRINNSGGTTIEFNNDLFIISPQTMYSASSGDFMVSKGIKSDVANVATADLSNPLPVATWTQTKQASNVQTNASGNWLFAELGTFAITQNKTVGCVYIYQYVPGERIAKYVLFPNNVFPAPPVAINLDPTYRDTEGNEVSDENSSTRANEDAVDLLSFDGYAYWAKPNYNNDAADKYRYNCYKVKLYQEGDVMPITTEYKLGSAELNALGSETTPKTVRIGNKEFEYNYRLPITNADNKRIWRIEVFATYANIEPGKESDTHDSEVSYDHTSDLYKGVAAEGTVKVYTQPNYPVWVDSKGKVVYKYMHRVDIDFNKPVFDGLRVEPVTHYEIWIDKDKNGEYEEQLKNFNLMTGKYNSATRAEVGTIASQIEVTDGKIVTAEYNPNESKGYALGETESEAHRNSGNYECVLTFYQIGSINPNEGGAMGEGDKSIELNPVNWNYQLRSVYAAGNAKITTTEIYDMETGGSPILTGVEAVNGGVSSLKLYPIPTDFILNVESGEPINVIEIYNEVGQLMMSVSGDQTQKMQLDLSDLFDGYYFVKINSNAPVKILKK